jgi:ATP-dependent DNA helicase RecQ
MDTTAEAPGVALAAWLGLAAALSVALLPPALRRDLARAALADGEAALALGLLTDDTSREGGYMAVAALLALGRPAEALAALEERLGQSASIEAARLQAEALLALGNRERALDVVRGRVEQQPDAVTAWAAAGAVALAAGALDEAAAAYDEARALSPQSSTAVIGLARVRLAAGDPADAVTLLEPLAEGGAATVLGPLAEALAALGDAERAAALQAELAERRAAHRANWRARLEATPGASGASDGFAAAAPLPTARRGSSMTPALAGSAPAPLAGQEVPEYQLAGIPSRGPAAAPPTGRLEGGVAPGSLAGPTPPIRPVDGGEPVAGRAPFAAGVEGGAAPSDGAGVELAAGEAEAPASPALVEALREYFAFDAFRPGQAAVCQAVLDGRDTLAVMPTGAGKSLCFQLPAMLLDGVTVVVSPLVALMKDQLDGLPAPVYEHATLLNSTLDAPELLRRTEALGAGRYRLVYVAPERLAQPGLVAALRRAGVARVVVDEAHCVSAWGHDFRPDYLTIGTALERLGSPPLLAVTATASPAVRADIGRGLGRELSVLQTPLFRPNLRYEVLRQPNADAKMRALVGLCQADGGSVVVYVNSRERTEELARVLRRHGVQAAHYHAGLPTDERTSVQDAFMLDRTRVIVATVAFGMGVDKANIRMVVHFSLPESLEAYVQESGRAGRDGRPARCVLLVAPSDKASLTRWLHAERLSLDDLRAVYRGVRAQLGEAELGLMDERGLGAVFADTEAAETRGRVALSLLERAGLLERLGTVPAGVAVEPLLGAAGAADPRLERLAQGGRQTYAGLALADLLEVPPAELEPWLLDARETGALRYRALGRALAVRLHPAPADTAARLERLLAEYAAHQDRRVADVVAYTERADCRHVRICRHFGQRLDPPCGACDVCAPADHAHGRPARAGVVPVGLTPALGGSAAPGTPGGVTAPHPAPAAAVLGCLAEAPFALTKTGVARVLIGSVAAPLPPDRTRHYGVLAGLGRKAVETVVDRLLADGYLARQPVQGRDGREYSVLVLTPVGRAGPPPWDGPVAVAPPRRTAAGLTSVDAEAYDLDRFERLRAWRRQEAAEAQIAPFMVFADSTLRALAALPPGAVSRDALARVPGIGPAKLARYGEALLALLSDEPEPAF